MYRKFPQEQSDDDDDETVDGSEINTVGSETSKVRPLRRGDIKPRLLFPTAAQRATRSRSKFDTEEEESTTDIEVADSQPQDVDAEEKVHTPTKPDFVPATPPDTAVRVTRSKDVLGQRETTPTDATLTASGSLLTSSGSMSVEASGAAHPTQVPVRAGSKPTARKHSPFDSWHRVKPGHHRDSTDVPEKGGRKRSATAFEQDMDEEFEVEPQADGKKRARSQPRAEA